MILFTREWSNEAMQLRGSTRHGGCSPAEPAAQLPRRPLPVADLVLIRSMFMPPVFLSSYEGLPEPPKRLPLQNC
jgi:hypothetical protein